MTYIDIRESMFNHLPRPFVFNRRSQTKPYWICRVGSRGDKFVEADTFQELLNKINSKDWAREKHKELNLSVSKPKTKVKGGK